MTRMIRILATLAVVGVPAFGWFADGWSGATTLAVYWFETVATSALICARASLHQRWTPRYGHFRYAGPQSGRRPKRSSFVAGFAVVSSGFCAAHAIFLGAILLLLRHNGRDGLVDVDWRSVGTGCLVVLTILVVDFAVDAFSLRRWSFWQLEQLANHALNRVIVVQVTLMVGLVAVALTDAPATFFSVFVVIKTMAALADVLPQYEPEQAPKWLCTLMNRMPNVRPGDRFEDYWVKDRTDERARRERNERPWASAAT